MLLGYLNGKKLELPSNVIVQYNSFENNAYGGLNYLGDETATSVDATKNWWGSKTGPETNNPGGTGLPYSGNIVFSPWLGDGTDTDEAIGFQPYYRVTSLVFSMQPGNAGLGELLDPQPVVTVYDEIGNVATQFVGTVTLALETKPGSGVLAGTLTVNIMAGVATFTDVKVTSADGAGYALKATAGSLSEISSPFDIIDPSEVEPDEEEYLTEAVSITAIERNGTTDIVVLIFPAMLPEDSGAEIRYVVEQTPDLSVEMVWSEVESAQVFLPYGNGGDAPYGMIRAEITNETAPRMFYRVKAIILQAGE